MSGSPGTNGKMARAAMASTVATTPMRTARTRNVLTRSGGRSMLMSQARRRCGLPLPSGQHHQIRRLEPLAVLEGQHGPVLGVGRDMDREELVDGVEHADRAPRRRRKPMDDAHTRGELHTLEHVAGARDAREILLPPHG